MCGCLSCTPHWAPGPQPRHVPWMGIKLVTLWFTGWHSVHWATPARPLFSFLNFIFFVDTTDIPIYPPLPTSTQPSLLPSLWPSPHHCPCPWVMHVSSLANPFTFFHPVPLFLHVTILFDNEKPHSNYHPSCPSNPTRASKFLPSQSIFSLASFGKTTQFRKERESIDTFWTWFA